MGHGGRSQFDLAHRGLVAQKASSPQPKTDVSLTKAREHLGSFGFFGKRRAY